MKKIGPGLQEEVGMGLLFYRPEYNSSVSGGQEIDFTVLVMADLLYNYIKEHKPALKKRL